MLTRIGSKGVSCGHHNRNDIVFTIDKGSLLIPLIAKSNHYHKVKSPQLTSDLPVLKLVPKRLLEIVHNSVKLHEKLKNNDVEMIIASHKDNPVEQTIQEWVVQGSTAQWYNLQRSFACS